MKKSLVVLAAMAFVVAMVSGAFAGSIAPKVGAKAVIIDGCSTGGDGVLDFGTLDSVTDAAGRTEADTYVTTKPVIYCTKGSTFTVTAAGDNGGTGVGSGYKLTNGTDTITYSISYATPVTGQGATVNIGGTSLSTDLNLKAGFAAGALNDAPASTYTDTITFTINF
ncbi:MAG: hypothetical protein STSR0002_10210 [Smithella sp.]|jgi:spore coat protein U-like protein